MTRIIPVFVNSQKVEISNDATALDAVRRWNESAAKEVASGVRVLLDDRGLPVDPSTIVHGGSIFRLVLARAAGELEGEAADGGE